MGDLFNNDSYFRSILQNNIYGVDLNPESVEITKLNLWLKTAEKGKKLTTLKNNIKCGNSLIDDPEAAGIRAFKWEEEFADIMQAGGFDVVAGNPPYGVNFSNEEKAILKSIDKDVPDFGENYREKILNNHNTLSILDLFDDNTFVDTSVRTCVFTFETQSATTDKIFEILIGQAHSCEKVTETSTATGFL